uniref:Uncharacterized protein n=1 Tax=Heterorhabditis bacteriophora TaxID=37862 RepID=A0A1I7W956_HETBA
MKFLTEVNSIKKSIEKEERSEKKQITDITQEKPTILTTRKRCTGNSLVKNKTKFPPINTKVDENCTNKIKIKHKI